MWENDESWLPEGYRLQTGVNREYTGSVSGLCRAMEQGRILEGMAVLCDESFTLTVELCGGLVGYIPRQEVAEGREIKDVAVLSRVGKAVCFCVSGIEDGRVMLSRRAAQRRFLSERAFCAGGLRPGDILPAKITHLEPFGAFADIGCGVVSMLPIDSISVSRISHPRDRFRPGCRIRAAVKAVDRERQRIFITHKELLGNWEENAAAFSPGQTVCGVVRSVESYGVFVELTPNLAGLAEYKGDVHEGEQATVFIKSILPDKMKMKLVLVDSFEGEKEGMAPLRYFLPPEVSHIDVWRYSPACCEKTVETVFEA